MVLPAILGGAPKTGVVAEGNADPGDEPPKIEAERSEMLET